MPPKKDPADITSWSKDDIVDLSDDDVELMEWKQVERLRHHKAEITLHQAQQQQEEARA